MKNYLNFESELKNLEDELDKLKDPYNQDGLSEVNTVKIGKVEEEINQKLKKFTCRLILGKLLWLLGMKTDQEQNSL